MIYLDHAAATPVHPKVLAVMQPYFAEQFFNPSAPYLAAKQVRTDYQSAKARLARTIGAKAPDLVITAGATESINLAFTVLQQFSNSHCLILATEHAAVQEVAKQYSRDLISVDQFGLIDFTDLRAKIKPHTVLISVSAANNEIGTIQPIAKIAALVQEIRHQRLAEGNLTPLYLHSDASQAFGLLDLSVSRLGVDLLTLNAAKIYGPKGIGTLYLSRDIKLQPITYGGGQERGLRSGTENVPALIGFAAAAELAKEHLSYHRQTYQKLTTLLRQILETADTKPHFLGHPKHQLANFCPVSFPGLDAERLIYLLEAESIYLSTGAACAASKGQKSQTLQVIGLPDAYITGSLRISLGNLNSEDNIKQAGAAIIQAVNQETSRIHHG
ncbi:MAG: cysteine desulfurase family protein [Candidatus Saccharibacteria bacterium]|nr:cysteine desulfurase family protein [Candidatus Saccharibacteria bacterium]